MMLHLNNYGSNEGPHVITGRLGSPGLPMLAHVATPAHQAHIYNPVDCTVTGPVCGDCTDNCGYTVRHASADHIRACYYWTKQEEEQYLAELPLIRAGVL